MEKVRGGGSGECAGRGGDPGGRGMLWGRVGCGGQCTNRDAVTFNTDRRFDECEAEGSV